MSAQHVNDWVMGEIANAVDLDNANEVMFTFDGYIASLLVGGGSFNGPPATGLVASVISPTQVSIGGGSQLCVLLGRVCDETPTTNLTFATNESGSPRSDLIIGQPIENQINSFTRNVRQPDTTLLPTTCYQLQESAQFQVVTGLGGEGNFGTVPAGWVAVAQVDVPGSGAAITTANVTMLLPTLVSVIESAAVTALNNITGNIALVNLDGSVTITPDPSNQRIILAAAAAAAAVGSLNGLTGALSLTCPDGTISIVPSGASIALRAIFGTSVTSIGVSGDAALHGAVTLQAGSGIVLTQSGNVIGIAATPPVLPIGSAAMSSSRITGSTMTVTLPFELSTGTEWHLYAQAFCDLGSGRTMTLTGFGANSTWEGPQTVSDQIGIEQVEIDGFSRSGDTPYVTLTFPNGAPTGGGYKGVCTIWAVRIS
jgi:hypothetical protein